MSVSKIKLYLQNAEFMARQAKKEKNLKRLMEKAG